jgi:hypothetical protein
LNKYAKDFMAWWEMIQPEWRCKEGMDTLVDGSEDWDSLRIPGANGLLSVVAGLFFWGVEVYRQGATVDMWLDALTDVSAAFSHL